MKSHYDAIVVGARVAGAPTAMLLARKGWRVLLVDKTTFPSDTVSTHMITVEGSAQLNRWGVLVDVEASGCPAITNIDLDLDFPRYGHFTLTGFPHPVDGGFAAIYAPKRTVLDKILVEAAEAAAVEVREGFSVSELLVENDRVVGIRGRNNQGQTVTERAEIVVGADGYNSMVAKAVAAQQYHYAPPKAFGYYTYWSGVPLSGLEFYTRPQATVIAFPTHDDQAAVFVERPERYFAGFKTDVSRNYMDTVTAVAPDLAERIRSGGTLEHRFAGVGTRPNYFRRSSGPGWALVGDAGVHKDPVTAQGITDAFRDAELLANAIDAGMSGRQSMPSALSDYERRRDAALKPLYDFIVDHAAMEPFDDMFQDVLAALRDNPDMLSKFFGVIQNTVAWDDFFNPINLSILFDLVPAEPAAVW